MYKKDIRLGKSVLIYGVVMGATGYLILHPISMIIVKHAGNIPYQPDDNIIGLAFSLHHLPMGIYFSLLCIVFGILVAFCNHVISIKSQQIQLLEDLLPICSNCKAIRNDSNTEKGTGEWIPLEYYFAKMSDKKLSHGICPNCIKKLYPNFIEKDEDFISKVNSY